MDWLRHKQAGDVTANEAVRAIDTGFELEALALGEATDRVKVEEDDDRVQRFSDEELELIIRYARRAQS